MGVRYYNLARAFRNSRLKREKQKWCLGTLMMRECNCNALVDKIYAAVCLIVLQSCVTRNSY